MRYPVVEPKCFLVGSELADDLRGVLAGVGGMGLPIHINGPDAHGLATDVDASVFDITSLPAGAPGFGATSTFAYIYTSGATGLLKAAIALNQVVCHWHLLRAGLQCVPGRYHLRFWHFVVPHGCGFGKGRHGYLQGLLVCHPAAFLSP